MFSLLNIQKFIRKIKYFIRLFSIIVSGKFDLKQYYEIRNMWFFKSKNSLINFSIFFFVCIITYLVFNFFDINISKEITIILLCLYLIYGLYTAIKILPFLKINDTEKALKDGIQLFISYHKNELKTGNKYQISIFVNPFIILVSDYIKLHLEKNIKSIRGNKKPFINTTNNNITLFFDYEPYNLLEYLDEHFIKRYFVAYELDYVKHMKYDEILYFSKELSLLDLSGNDNNRDIDNLFKIN